MCTVTFLPVNSNSFILTHNRDEHFTRSIALLPVKKYVHDAEIIAPIDEQGGGTWFATSNKYSLCLLNGGFVKHLPNPPYKHSRGLVILDFFNFDNFFNFKNNYDFNQLEPFTLIVVEHECIELHQLIFDGKELHYTKLDSEKRYIWSSTTLYNLKQQEERKLHFEIWNKANPKFNQLDILNFHSLKEGMNIGEGFIINRQEKLRTVSVTSVMKDEAKVILKYQDLINGQTAEIGL